LLLRNICSNTPCICLHCKERRQERQERDGGNDNGNTVTAQINKQKASQSGFDNVQEQEHKTRYVLIQAQSVLVKVSKLLLSTTLAATTAMVTEAQARIRVLLLLHGRIILLSLQCW
jgi:hypothetical protein